MPMLGVTFASKRVNRTMANARAACARVHKVFGPSFGLSAGGSVLIGLAASTVPGTVLAAAAALVLVSPAHAKSAVVT
jgi:hypothetical protein